MENIRFAYQEEHLNEKPIHFPIQMFVDRRRWVRSHKIVCQTTTTKKSAWHLVIINPNELFEAIVNYAFRMV